VNVLDVPSAEPGAFHAMDRDFERLHRLRLAGAFFIVRAKSNLQATQRAATPTPSIDPPG